MGKIVQIRDMLQFSHLQYAYYVADFSRGYHPLQCKLKFTGGKKKKKIHAQRRREAAPLGSIHTKFVAKTSGTVSFI